MKLKPIIESLLDNDLYKFSMGQAIYHQFQNYMTEWEFKCRNEGVYFTAEMVAEITAQVKHYCTLRYKKTELNYLRSILWIKDDYVNYLKRWYPDFEDFTITHSGDKGLEIKLNGVWLDVSMYETPVLAIVNEVYFRMKYDYDILMTSFVERLDEKFNKLKYGNWYLRAFSDFGFRRRLSFEAQDIMLQKFKHLNDTKHCCTDFVGTSDVYFAMKHGLPCTGTQAHEWIMGVGQGDPKQDYAHSNWYAMQAWVKEYGILNGTALTDTITTKAFLLDFQLTFATLYSGVRHDSGDPFAWGDMMLDAYKKLGIDPVTKTLLFSDSLNFEKATKIAEYFRGKAKVAFGIGTYLTNDTCVDPLNIVLKMVTCNGHDVAKLSDAPGKNMCRNQEYIDRLHASVEWRVNNAA